MRIFNKDLIEKFVCEHKKSQLELSRWVHTIENGRWRKPDKFTAFFQGAKHRGNCRYVFRFCSGTYQMVALMFFSSDMVIIRFVGTVKACAKIDCSTI